MNKNRLVISRERMKGMQLVKRRLTDITPYGNNPRKNDKAAEAVKESIMQCGYIAPIILDENGVILAGHTRYKALQQLGHDEAECIIKEGLTEEQKRKYRLLDNKTNELAEWDFELLEMELAGLDFGELELDWGIDTDEPSTTEREDLSDEVKETFEVIVECASELQQEEVFYKLTQEGYTCRVLTL